MRSDPGLRSNISGIAPARKSALVTRPGSFMKLLKPQNRGQNGKTSHY